ncbi:GNAT family N-acetyltransferase [Microbacterium sp. 2FI]|uniref:GNAT family N-acetyltransferase n=1 Tax=Microbacterium sp. 2FI TaxID=2502193 RepID=UPI0010F79EEE|nr:GNAT family N-acetyltransferase [Microbacterium sp. 2FI]
MTADEAGLSIDPVVIPLSLDGPDATDFLTMVDVRNAVLRERTGDDDLAYSAVELLPGWQNDEDEEGHVWIARQDGIPIARFVVEFPMEAGSDVVWFAFDVLAAGSRPDVWNAGFDLLERTARAHGRHVLQSEPVHRPGQGEVLKARSGFGEIPIDDQARALLDRGFALEQVDRISALDLQGDRSLIERGFADALAASAGAYTLVEWTFPTPDEFVDGYAAMMARMSTDAPSADLDWDAETWDAERIRRYEREAIEGERFTNIVAARHVDSGELVAFTELHVGDGRTGVTEQGATLVLAEHRGHRLGMLVKAANLLTWLDLAPESPRVSTFNAEENRHMLAVNEALGFEPVGYAGGWKKVLED